MARTKHRHQKTTRGMFFTAIPLQQGVRSELSIEGVWTYPGEYVAWKYRYDAFTKETILVNYSICSYGVGTRL